MQVKVFAILRSQSIFGNEEREWFIESSLNNLKYALLSPMLMEKLWSQYVHYPFYLVLHYWLSQHNNYNSRPFLNMYFLQFANQEATGRLSCFYNKLEKCYDQQQILLAITHLPSLLYASFLNWPQLLLLQECCVIVAVFVSSER